MVGMEHGKGRALETRSEKPGHLRLCLLFKDLGKMRWEAGFSEDPLGYDIETDQKCCLFLGNSALSVSWHPSAKTNT